MTMTMEKMATEYLAAGLKQEMKHLDQIIKEIEQGELDPEALSHKITDLEKGLKKIRKRKDQPSAGWLLSLAMF